MLSRTREAQSHNQPGPSRGKANGAPGPTSRLRGSLTARPAVAQGRWQRQDKRRQCRGAPTDGIRGAQGEGDVKGVMVTPPFPPSDPPRRLAE